MLPHPRRVCSGIGLSLLSFMKQILQLTSKVLLVLLLMTVTAATAWAWDFEKNGVYYGFYEDGTDRVYVTTTNLYSGNAYKGNVIIPSHVSYEGKGYTVEYIGWDAFYNCPDLISVTLPNSIWGIGTAAFQGCKSLKTVNIPVNLHEIGDYAFSGCSSLSLDIVIPSNVTYIGMYAFSGCSSLTSITIPSSVKSFGERAFSGCSGKVTIDCDIPEGLFFYTTITELTIGNHTQNIGLLAFEECLDLQKVTFGENVDSISFNAFQNCRSLTSVTLPNSIRKLENSAFNGCWNMTEVTIGSGIEFVGWDAFNNCNKLRTVTCKAKKVPETGATAFANVQQKWATLKVPLSAIEQYKQADVWKEFGTIEPLSFQTTTSIALPSALVFGVGGQRQLAATVEPEYANRNVKWKSSDENVLKIDETGMVTPLSSGTATITATTIDGTGLSASCQATVIEEPIYTYEDFTDKVNVRWKWFEDDMLVGDAAPKVTTSDGRTTAAREDYKTTCDGTGELFTQTVEVPNGLYRVELYAAAAYTSGRGFASDVTEGDRTAVYAYVNTHRDEVRKYLPAHITTNFNSTGIDVVTFEDVEVTEETLTLGMVKEKPYTNWHVIQIKSLQRRVDELEKFDDFAYGKDNQLYPYASKQKKAAAINTARDVLNSATDNNSRREAINKAYRTCAESSALLEGLKGAVNMTSVIINPKAESGTNGWWTEIEGGSITTLNSEPWTDGEGGTSHAYFDGGNWNKDWWNGAFKQSVTLPAGHYQLSVMGRAAKNVTQTLFVNDFKAEMPHIGNTGGVFNNGWNQTSLEFELTETTNVELGVQGWTSVEHNWMSFSDFRLMQFPSIPTGIEDVQNGTQGSSDIYDLTGRRIAQKPAHGFYIQNGRKYLVR